MEKCLYLIAAQRYGIMFINASAKMKKNLKIIRGRNTQNHIGRVKCCLFLQISHSTNIYANIRQTLEGYYRRFMPRFFAFFFPDMVEALGFAHPFEFLDQKIALLFASVHLFSTV